MKVRIGLDEAGRGCVLGPLFVGAAVFESHTDDVYFMDLGVKDSKKLKPQKRELLFQKIKKHCSYSIDSITPAQIDDGNLNSLEFSSMVKVASGIIENYLAACIRKPEFEVFVDCPAQDSEKHAHNLLIALPHSCDVKVVSEHKADDKYVVVGAASIVAKVLRDNEIGTIKKLYEKEYGDIGSGYPSDWKTKNFLENYYSRHRDFPVEARLKWGTIEKIRREYSENSESNGKGLRDGIKNSKGNCQGIPEK